MTMKKNENVIINDYGDEDDIKYMYDNVIIILILMRMMKILFIIMSLMKMIIRRSLIFMRMRILYS